MLGHFITFEGGEGTGKSTQSRLLVDRLRINGLKVALTREPGGSPSAEAIRELVVTGSANRWHPLSELLLMYAARNEHWHQLIKPALEKGEWVICDRFADSSTAYQGYGRGIDLSFLETLYSQTIGAKQPNRTYVFDLSPTIGLERAHQRLKQQTNKEGRFESLNLEFHERVHQGFLKIAQQNPDRCKIIDASQTPEQIHENIWQDIEDLFIKF